MVHYIMLKYCGSVSCGLLLLGVGCVSLWEGEESRLVLSMYTRNGWNGVQVLLNCYEGFLLFQDCGCVCICVSV